MKHWQFYLAIIIFLGLLLMKVTEGITNDVALPADATPAQTPIQLMDEMRDLMENRKTPDMIQNGNLKDETKSVEFYKKYNENLYKGNKARLDTCYFEVGKQKKLTEETMNKNIQCGKDLNQKTNEFNKCNFQDFPPKNWERINTNMLLQFTRTQADQCRSMNNNIAAAIDKCNRDVHFYNTH